MKKTLSAQILRAIRRILLTVGLVLGGIWIYIAQPGFAHSKAATRTLDTDRMQETVRKLSVEWAPRSCQRAENLTATADYIATHFVEAGGRVSEQPFTVSNKPYKNICATFGPSGGPRLIVGAHYDAHSHTPGADDNASGIAGLIELAYLLGTSELPGQIELVAYTLEEPPYFATQHMGSYHHAEQTYQSGTPVAGVIVLEMIGYFNDDFGSQDYPARLFKLLYPNTGNFISVIGKTDQRPFTREVKIGMKGASDLSVRSVNVPAEIPGVDFSDHRNYWPFGYNAVMITDTAFYRNKAYHKENDTWDRLDYTRMGQVVLGVYSASLKILAESTPAQ